MKTSYQKSGPASTEKNEDPFVQIPLAILRRADISQTAKLIFGSIVSLARGTGYCFASDKYLAEQVGVSQRQAHRSVSELEALRLVLITGATSKRHLRPTYAKTGVSEEGELTPKTSAPYVKNVHIIESENKRENKTLTPAALFQKEQKDTQAGTAFARFKQSETARECDAWRAARKKAQGMK